MTTGTFTIRKGIIKFRHLKNPEVWCEETGEWIMCDEEKYKQEMELNMSLQKE